MDAALTPPLAERPEFQALRKNTPNATEKYPIPPEKYFTEQIKTLRRVVVLFFIFG